MQIVAHPESVPAVVTVAGEVGREDLPGLSGWFEAFLDRTGATMVVCDIADLVTTDLVVVDALARLRLSARRRGCGFVVRAAQPRLAELTAFLGLSEVLATEGR